MAKKSSLEPIAEFGQTAPTSPRPGQQPATPFQRDVVVRHAAPTPAPASPPSSDAVLQLLWHDERVRPELRKQPAWRPIIDGIAGDTDLALDATLARAPSNDADTARSVFELLTYAPPTSIESLGTVLREAVRQDGKLAPPLAVVAGHLRLVHDPVAKLELTAKLLEPFRGGNAELAQALAGMQPYIQEPRGAMGGADALSQQLFTAARTHLPGMPPEHFETTVERLLVEERRHTKRDLLGNPQVLARVDGIPAYLPEAAASALPLCAHLTVRLLVEIHPRLDDAESHPIALAVRAIARTLPPNAW